MGTSILENCDHLMFTGSTATGRQLAEQCGRRLIGFSASNLVPPEDLLPLT